LVGILPALQCQHDITCFTKYRRTGTCICPCVPVHTCSGVLALPHAPALPPSCLEQHVIILGEVIDIALTQPKVKEWTKT